MNKILILLLSILSLNLFSQAKYTVSLKQAGVNFPISNYTFTAELFEVGNAVPFLTLTEGSGITKTDSTIVIEYAGDLEIPSNQYIKLTRVLIPPPPPPVESGFTWDVSESINEDGWALILEIGDSMFATTSKRPWPSGLEQHPVPIDNALWQYTFSGGITEVTSDLAGSLQSPTYLYPANAQSPWPKFGNDLYTLTGVKPVFIKGNVGGAEFFKHGDLINWQQAPSGVLFDLTKDAFNAAKTIAGVTKPLLIQVMCGLNDASGPENLYSIRPTIKNFLDSLLLTYGADAQIRFINIFSPTPSARNIAVREFISDVVRNKNLSNVQLSLVHDSTYDDEFMYGLAADGHDQTHFHQRGNNLIGQRMVEYEKTPRIQNNILADDFPKFSFVTDSSATLSINVRINYKVDSLVTVYWAVYPSTDAQHTSSQILNGTGAITKGSFTTVGNVTESVNIDSLSNNTRYRVQLYSQIGSVVSPVFSTVSFRTGGIDPATTAMLARFSALNANWINKFTSFYGKLLDYDIEPTIDDIFFNGHNSSADKYVSMKGVFAPVSLGSGPTFVADQGLKTTSTTGDNRLDLGVNNDSFTHFSSSDGFYAINFFSDDNGISSGTSRAAFGVANSTLRTNRFLVTYNSSTNKVASVAINDGSNTHDVKLGSSAIQLNKLHIVSKSPTESVTVDSNVSIGGDTWSVIAAPAVSTSNTRNWYMFCQNNGVISARSAFGINFLAVGKIAPDKRDYLTLACKELGIGN